MHNKIAIGICTCLRPKMLSSALEGIKNLDFPDNVEIVLIIVDNDKEASAKKIVEKFYQNFPIKIIYSIENRRGISYARNRVLTEALQINSTEIAFMDDDAIADKNWLKSLYEFYLKNDSADVVTGPQIQIFPNKCPEYIKNNSFYKKKVKSTGQEMPDAATNNVLFSSEIVTAKQIWFDESLAFIGGEDTDFFNRASNQGAKILWTNEAIVRETVPESRVTIKWLLKRQLIRGYGLTCLRVRSIHDKQKLLKLFIKTLVKLIFYILFLLVSWIFGSTYFVEILSKCSKTLGRILLFLNKNVNGYQEIHGN